MAATRKVAVVQLLLLHKSFLPVVILSSKSLRVRLSRQALSPSLATLTVKADDKEFTARVRIDTPKEADYFRHGGILLYVLRSLRDAD